MPDLRDSVSLFNLLQDNAQYRDIYEQCVKMQDGAACSVIATSIVCDVPYIESYFAFKKQGRKHGRGTYEHMYKPALLSLGYQVVDVTSCFQGRTLRAVENEFDNGNYIIRATNHAVAVKNGKIIDWSAGRLKRIKQILMVEKV